MKSRGFTLIELLVVIAIIAMLSSIVMASIKGARDKASATYTAKTIQQYVTAMESYRIDNNTESYPKPSAPNYSGACFDTYPCYRDFEFDATLADSLKPYFPGDVLPKTMLYPVSIGSTVVTGTGYRCLADPLLSCKNASLTWAIPSNTECLVPGSVRIVSGVGPTTCALFIYNN